MFSDVRAELVSAEVEVEFEGEIDIMHRAEDFMHYLGVRISKDAISFVKRDGEIIEIEKKSGKKIFNQGKNTLNFSVKNGLINVEINHLYHYETERSLTEMKKGAFGVVCDENSRCLLYGCKLESI